MTERTKQAGGSAVREQPRGTGVFEQLGMMQSGGATGFRAIVENLPLTVFATVGVEQVCGYLNRTFVETFGYTLAELPSVAEWWPLAYPDEHYRREVSEEWNHRVARAHATQSPIEPMETVVACRDGSRKDISWGYIPIGEIAFAYGSDLTDRKRAEGAKVRLEEQAWQMQKAESLGRMAGAIAHHFSNQLQAVMGNLELALDGSASGEGIGDMLADAMRATRRVAEVTDLMRTYLGQKVGERRMLDLAELCRQCRPALELAIPERVRLQMESGSAGPAVRGSAAQLRQVLESLVSNACEAIGPVAGTVRVAVRGVPAAGIAGSQLHPIGFASDCRTYVCLEVADTGCGIANEDIGKLFDPFFSTKAVGRGMGLPATLGIVRAHGGAMEVASQPGVGSTVRVFLPADDQPGTVPVPPTGMGAGKGPRTVLVVEDEASVRRLAATLFRGFRLEVLEAADGIEALEVFRRHEDKIGLVFCDLTMPRLDGWGTLKALRQAKPGVHVVLTSGYSEAEVMDRSRADRPDYFIAKPYTRADIRQLVTRFWPSAK